MLQNGLYEQVISKGLEEELSQSDKLCQTAPIDSAEAAKVLSKYVAQVAEQRFQQLQDNGADIKDQIELSYSFAHDETYQLETFRIVTDQETEIPSITEIVPAAVFYENKNITRV